MPARAPRAPRATITTSTAAPVVAEPPVPSFLREEPAAGSGVSETPAPNPAAPETPGTPAPDPQTASAQPSGYKGLKVWQRAMELAAAVHALTRAFPADQDALGADLRRSAAQVPAYVAAGNSLFQRAEYVQYLSAAHGALARLETLLLLAERLGLVAPADGAPLLSQAGQVGYLLRALTRALQPPGDGAAPAPRSTARRTAPTPTPADT